MAIDPQNAYSDSMNANLATEWPDSPACSANVGNLERLASVAGGAGLVALGLSRRSLPGLLVAAAGGALIYRGTTGYCHLYGLLGLNTAQEHAEGAVVKNGIFVRLDTEVNASPEAVFQLWRDFSNLPRFMEHLESVRVVDPVRSHWVVKGPAEVRVEWDAEIINEREPEMISWRSVEGGDVDHAGSVRFVAVPGGPATRVEVQMSYLPPAGYVGATIARIFGDSAEQQIRDDLQRFKQFAESHVGAPHGESHSPSPAQPMERMDIT